MTEIPSPLPIKPKPSLVVALIDILFLFSPTSLEMASTIESMNLLIGGASSIIAVSYTHLRAHET